MDLLYSIFPGDVAQKLWQGQPVPARKFDDVTMLFSDIVGFTAVCAQCTPMQVISMLNELYTRFDYQCGILDVYKVSGETNVHPHHVETRCHLEREERELKNHNDFNVQCPFWPNYCFNCVFFFI